MYPTLLQDFNGNQIAIKYKTSAGAGWANSSARIDEIDDIRNLYNGSWTYKFTYNTDTIPHLTSIATNIGDSGSYTFTYLSNQSLSSPYNSASYGSTNKFLQRVTGWNYLYHQFTYNGSGEITQIQLPYLGKLGYDYTTTTYSTGTKHREVQYRKLYKDVNGSTYTQYSFSHEATPGASTRAWTQITDPGGVGRKYWEFGASGVSWGLVTKYQGIHLSGGSSTVKAQTDYTWTLDAAGKNSYISAVLKTNDPGQSYQAQSKTEQTIDNNGNVPQVKTYDYNSLTTPLRTDNFTYTNNRLVTGPNVSIQYGPRDNLGNPTGYRLFDASVLNDTTPVNPVYVSSLGNVTTITYDVAGMQKGHSTNGVNSTATFNVAQNFAVPTSMSVGSTTNFDVNIAYNGQLGVASTTGSNGQTTSVTSNAAGQPTSTTSPYGATATASYGGTSTTTINNRWSKTTSDGLGRPILAESGYGTTTVSAAETEYDSCGCSPTGKVKRTALPHAPGATPIWTTMTYDGIGRTLSSVTEGTETTSTTTYVYEGNTVKVTDAAGKWKKYTSNVLGQLVQVNEPNPAGGSDYVTNYTYNSLGNLTGVSMPRPTGTQTRTFVYNGNGQITSATNPESGTVTYAYNSDQTLLSKTDAKGQKTEYTYDSVKRVTQTRRYPNGTTEDTSQREDFYYDSNPFDSTFTENPKGRLTAVQYKGAPGPGGEATITEMFSYHKAGAILKKRLRIKRPNNNNSGLPGQTNNPNLDLDATYTYDTEGRNTSVQYPGSWDLGSGSAMVFTAGPTFTNEFDSMGRLKKLTSGGADIISDATYNVMGELLTMTGANGAPSETRTYNSIGQMTALTSGSMQRSYAFSSASNNGKITSETDPVSGETVTYTYDSLNRLASATSSDNPGWGQSFGYDGFGNLTNVNVTKGSAPSLSVSYNSATNRRTTDSADANGNILQSGVTNYDVENRITQANISGGTVKYSYAPGNKRLWRGTFDGSGNQGVDEITFYSASGAKLAAYNLTGTNYGPLYATCTGYYQYFGGKLLKNAQGYVNSDRLGSIGKFFPYGQERPSATSNGKEKFATYFRDSETGLDYAQARYHSSGDGRFLSPDPYAASAGPEDPGSWNRYAYTRGDPINRIDPAGTQDCNPEKLDCYCQIYGDPNGPNGYDPHCDQFFCPPGICGEGDPQPSQPSCEDFKEEMQWSDQQFVAASVISVWAARSQVNLSGFTLWGGSDGMQVNKDGRTQMNITGSSSALGAMLGSLCTDSTNEFCFHHDGNPLEPWLHKGLEFNIRQNSKTDALQITGKWDAQKNQWVVSLDIDPHASGTIGHLIDMGQNTLSGKDTDYSEVAKRLGIDPRKENSWCR